MNSVLARCLPLEGSEPFVLHSFDVKSVLPVGWEHQVAQIVCDKTIFRSLKPTSVTSREDQTKVSYVKVGTVPSEEIARGLSWLTCLYRGLFFELAKAVSRESVYLAGGTKAVNLNIQTGSMRYESHTDSNPIQGMLYFTTHNNGDGGELVVANNPNASSKEEVDADCQVFYPQAGQFVLFDARKFPHYVRPLQDKNQWRIAAAMNFYTPSCSEKQRPADLNEHLYGRMPISKNPPATNYHGIKSSLSLG